MTGRVFARRAVAVVIVGHGLVHLLGAATGLGWVDVPQLTRPMSAAAGIAWLATALLLIGTGLLLAASARWWWITGAVGVVASQTLILTAWGDAAAGSAANAVLLVAVVHRYASHGPRSYRVEFHRRSGLALEHAVAGPLVQEADLAQLPDLVAAYVRRSGAVGQPRVASLHAHVSGRIRSSASSRWMPFHGEQVNTFGPDSSRFFFIEATLLGVPMDVLHTFVGPAATMRVRAASLLRVVDAAGPEMDQGETVTVFNDICVLAPSALIDATIRWQTIDDHHVRGTFTRGNQTVTAVLSFNDDHDLVDFSSDDRLRAAPNGRDFFPQRWSTPLSGHRSLGEARIAAAGDGRWHAPPPEGAFTYIEFQVDRIAYNTGPSGIPPASQRSIMRDTPRPAPTSDLDSPEQIAEMVRRFYADVAMDDLLGPMFNDVAQVDWSEHLPKLTAFWCRALLGQQGYAGNPFRAHARIHEQRAFTPAHFERWLMLFHETLELGWIGPNVSRARALADDVARVHRGQLLGDDAPGVDTRTTIRDLRPTNR